MTEKLSMQELLAKLELAIASSDDIDLEEIKEDYGEQLKDILNGLEDAGDPDLGDFRHVDTDCVAGDGSEAYKVYEYKPTGQVFGFDGWYASHEGYEWNEDVKEMEPFTVTHYRPKD